MSSSMRSRRFATSELRETTSEPGTRARGTEAQSSPSDQTDRVLARLGSQSLHPGEAPTWEPTPARDDATMMKIASRVIVDLIQHAKDKAPIEACGYLAARDDGVVSFYPMTNMDASEEHFTLDPKEQFDAARDMRGKGLRLAAVYHSHPATPARPSREDIKQAHDPELSYVIISLKGTIETVKSFKIKDGRVELEEIQIVDQGSSITSRFSPE